MPDPPAGFPDLHPPLLPRPPARPAAALRGLQGAGLPRPAATLPPTPARSRAPAWRPTSPTSSCARWPGARATTSSTTASPTRARSWTGWAAGARRAERRGPAARRPRAPAATAARWRPSTTCWPSRACTWARARRWAPRARCWARRPGGLDLAAVLPRRPRAALRPGAHVLAPGPGPGPGRGRRRGLLADPATGPPGRPAARACWRSRRTWWPSWRRRWPADRVVSGPPAGGPRRARCWASAAGARPGRPAPGRGGAGRGGRAAAGRRGARRYATALALAGVLGLASGPGAGPSACAR